MEPHPIIWERAMVDSAIHVLIRYEDDRLWATVEEYPGVFATGDNLEELRESLEEGISLYSAPEGEEPEPIQLSPLRLARAIEASASAQLIPA